MIDNQFVNGELDIKETKIFNAKDNDHTVQFIVNIMNDHTATVKYLLPKYPGEPPFCDLIERHRDKGFRVVEHIHQYIKDRGATLTYMGY